MEPHLAARSLMPVNLTGWLTLTNSLDSVLQMNLITELHTPRNLAKKAHPGTVAALEWVILSSLVIYFFMRIFDSLRFGT